MNITEGQFIGFVVTLLICLVAWGINGAHNEEVRMAKEKVEFARMCESHGKSLAEVNKTWVCLKYGETYEDQNPRQPTQH